jgi:Ca2+-dependent lipid-binding protein
MIREMKLGYLKILRVVVDVQSDEIIKRLLMQETRCNVRLYIVRAFNLAERDNDSPSDPYVIVSLGDDIRNDRKDW